MRLFLLLLGLCLPSTTFAHTRWFASDDLPKLITHEPTMWYLGVCGIGAFVTTLLAIYLHQHGFVRMKWLKPQAEHVYERAAATFAMVTGAFLLIAGTHGYVFSPNLVIGTGAHPVFIVLEIVIGIAFLVGIATRTAAILLMVLWLMTFFTAGFVATIENIWVLSTAVFIAIMGNDYFSLLGWSFFKRKMQRYKPYALSLLRLGTGLTLLILGFSEKILVPELGMNFLNQFNWNFMQLLGFNFSDYFFVLAAGTVESLLGLIFVLGVVTRLNALVAIIIFMIPMFILGPIELAGHMPHFAAIILLLLFGNGGHFLMVKKYKDANWAE